LFEESRIRIICQRKNCLTIDNYYAHFLSGQLEGNENLPDMVEHTASPSGFGGVENEDNEMEDEALGNDQVMGIISEYVISPTSVCQRLDSHQAPAVAGPSGYRSRSFDQRRPTLTKSTDSFLCLEPDCGKVFGKKVNMDYHFKSKHLMIRYKCYSQCGQDFASKQSRKNHRDSGRCLVHLQYLSFSQ